MLNEIFEILYNIDHIPSHPRVKAKIQDILSDFDPSKGNEEDAIDEITKFLSYDPSLSIEFLKIANSNSFGLKNKISSIHNALHVLDKELIRLIISQHPVIPDTGVYHTGIEETFLKLINHSAEVHIIVQNLLNKIFTDKPIDINFQKELLTASIIHDIGLFFLLVYFPASYEEIIDRIKEGETAQKKRKDYLIPDHAMIGSVLCEFWNLPPSIRNSIAFHHYPWFGDESSSIGADILYLADSISLSFYELYYLDNVQTHIMMRRRMPEILNKLKINFNSIIEIRRESSIQIKNLYAEFEF